jgi:hypothetical protein
VTVTGRAVPVEVVVPVAVTRVDDENVVLSETPLSFTIAPERNPVPLTVRVNATPAVTWVGVTEEITGAGLRIVTDAVPTAEGTATLVARIVTVAGLGTADGAE